MLQPFFLVGCLGGNYLLIRLGEEGKAGSLCTERGEGRYQHEQSTAGSPEWLQHHRLGVRSGVALLSQLTGELQ